MVFERAHHFWGDTLNKFTRHAGFQHASHGEHLLGFLCRGGRHKSPTRGFHADQSVLRELKQGLPHQRARHAEMVRQFLLGQFGPRQQPVLDNGARQGLDDAVRGRALQSFTFVHGGHDSQKNQNCIHFGGRVWFPSIFSQEREFPWV